MARLLIGITGSLGVIAMPAYLLTLRQYFTEIKIIMTHTATHFIPKETMEMFSEGIYTNEFPLSKANMSHVELARWASVLAVIPASANILAQTAYGFTNTLLSATIMAYKKRVIFFPNMNSAMWEKKALQRNLSIIKEDGHLIINPLERPAFEYASRQVEINHVMPPPESVLSILKMEDELERVNVPYQEE